ncbi:MmgE/PrpD family protein (plasmid) [Sulfitobacter sp. LCG007]
MNATLTEALVPIVTRAWTAEDRTAAAGRVLDWAGCAAAGRATAEGAAFAAAMPGPDHPEAVASLFGSFGSLLEMDDVHKAALLHPGPVIIPAALSLAGEASGTRLLDAILGGYEAMIRLGRSVGPQHYARFHNTSTCGGIGSAVAASIMLGLPPERIVWAMGHAMSLSGGLWQCRNEPGATKHLHVSEAARRGVMAARAAAAGIAAPKAILDGPQGFFAALAPDGATEQVLADPEAQALLHSVSTKPWPACRHIHPSIDALLELRGRIAGRQIATVEVESYRDALVFCDRPDPQDTMAALFSLQHAAAVVLTDGEPTLAAFERERLTDQRYATMRQRVRVAEDSEITARYPAHFGARARVRLADGSVFDAHVPDALGDPENPIDSDGARKKFVAVTAWAGLSPDKAARLSEAIDALAADAPGARVREAMLELLR